MEGCLELTNSWAVSSVLFVVMVFVSFMLPVLVPFMLPVLVMVVVVMFTVTTIGQMVSVLVQVLLALALKGVLHSHESRPTFYDAVKHLDVRPGHPPLGFL